jgi:AbrB family looped-hinge helix DNA binding protein
MLMANQNTQTFNPLETLREVSDTTRNVQSDLMKNMSSMQNKSMETMFQIGQMLPSFMNWGAYKTTVSSNGRISIPEAERNALGLGEGDLVQVIVLPIAKKSKNREVKQ